jgi:anhydro-N-acetylmuramic acid kinase
MTGTSCDGADLALLSLRPRGREWRDELVATATRPFPPGLRARLRAAQAGNGTVVETAILARDFSEWLGTLCASQLARWEKRKIGARRLTLVSAHGQTIWHAPRERVSVQLIDPSILAFATGCTVASAFRQPDLARGGEGAPLVALYHWLRAREKLDGRLPVAFHNVGGIANLTYVPRERGGILAFDTGPGNALIDLAAARATRGKLSYDRDGKIASSALGAIDWGAIRRLGGGPYFRRRPPKSTGREVFNEKYLARLPGRGAVLVANATALTAHTMARAYADFVLKKGRPLRQIFVCGGGARNPVLVELFAIELARFAGGRILVSPVPAGLAPPEYLEAMAFARLGLEALRGRAISLASVTGAKENAVGAGVFAGRNHESLVRAVF